MHNITKADIFKINDGHDFEQLALSIFRHQAQHTSVYRDYLFYLRFDPRTVEKIEEIPFLPIEFYKSRIVYDQLMAAPEKEFYSSGTENKSLSRHAVADLFLYEESFRLGFIQQYGAIEDYVFIALLPSYLEREGSSLVYMCDKLIQWSADERSGFYLNEYQQIKNIIDNNSTKKIMLIGVSFALLDFAEQMPFEMQHCIVMETGGMKGRRKEMLREELHQQLEKAFQLKTIHSEYGMTELLSQAYSKGEGWFNCPPWMKVLIRDSSDPMSQCEVGKTGGINCIDLANLHSCSFIATQDLGKVNEFGQFAVLGRFDHADVRGCNLMVS